MKPFRFPRKSICTILATVLLITCLGVGALAAELVVESAAGNTRMKPVAISREELLENVNERDRLDGIVIQTLPDASSGQLYQNSRAILRGEGIAVEALGDLRFMPAGNGEIKTHFTFVPVYNDGKTGDIITHELNVTGKRNNRPVASDVVLKTYRNIAIGGTFTATDPDGDELTYKLISQPKLGNVKLDATGSADFMYEPYQNKGGTDKFTYVAMDADGAVSQTGEITVSIEKSDSKLTYSDMSGHKSHYAAIRLAEKDVFTGRKISESYYFEPDELITRGEFIAMAVSLTDARSQPPTIRTSFSDDTSIPVWIKPFAVAAVKAGFVQGVPEGEALKLNANNPITRAEAAMVLNNVSGTANAATMLSYTDEETIPAWAKQSVVNMDTLGIMTSLPDGSMALDSAVTRADAAQMLESLLCYMERPVKKTGLFSWIK